MDLHPVIYTDIGSINTIAIPMVSVSCFIDPYYYKDIAYFLEEEFNISRLRDLTHKRIVRIIQIINRFYDIHVIKSLPIPIYLNLNTIHSPFLNYLGIDVSIHKSRKVLKSPMEIAIDTCLSNTEYQTTPIYNISSIKEDQEYIDDPFLYDLLEYKICYVYARLIQSQWLTIWGSYYPMLNIDKCHGAGTIRHVKELCKLKYLPPFYLWERTMLVLKAYSNKGLIELPDWYYKELEYYKGEKDK